MNMALIYTPGVVLSLERLNQPPSGTLRSREPGAVEVAFFGFGESITYFYSPMARLALRVWLVAPGDELGFAAERASLPFVIATSLNYVGRGTSDSHAKNQPTTGRDVIERRFSWGFPGPPPDSDPVFSDQVVGVINEDTGGHHFSETLIAVIDAGKEHCRAMLRTIDRIIRPRQGDSTKTLSVLASCVSITSEPLYDLFALSASLMAFFDVRKQIVAVSCSFDLGKYCALTKYNPAVGSMVYGFPFFERVLNEFRRVCRIRGYHPPMIFAAAGNRYGQQPRRRLAYPAVLPDVVAVTQLDRDGNKLADDVDIPTVASLKPCFAERLEEEKGTSVACAILAANYALWHEDPRSSDQSADCFERLALMLRSVTTNSPLELSEAKAPQSQEDCSTPPPERTPIPSVAWVFDPRQAPRHEDPVLLQRLMGELRNSIPGRELVLTGSGAFTEAWLQSNVQQDKARERSKDVLALLGDLDIVHTGSELTRRCRNRLISKIRQWLRECGAWDGEHPVPIQFLPLARWHSGIHSLQCVIPAASLFLTATGFIASWGKEVVRKVPLERYQPEISHWEANPQFQIGAAGLATGIIIGLNLELIRSALNITFNSYAIGAEITEYCEQAMEELKVTSNTLLLGYPGPGGSRLLGKRLRRVGELLEQKVAVGEDKKSCARALLREIKERAKSS